MVRKITLLGLFLGLTIWVNAQVYTVTPSNTYSATIAQNEYKDMTIYFHNVSGDSLQMEWENTTNTLGASVNVTMCDYQACYPFIPQNRVMEKVGDNDSAFIKLTVNSPDVGSGMAEFKVWQRGNQAATEQTITFNLNVIVGLDEELASQVNVSPNPARNFVVLNAKDGFLQEGWVKVFDLNGAMLRQQRVSATDAQQVSLDGMASGVYMLRYETKDAAMNQKIFKID